jgi:Sulfotransferase family
MLALIHIEKCGGTTLIDVLRRNFRLDHFDVIPRERDSMVFTADDLRDLLDFRPTVQSIAGHSVRLGSALQSVVPGIQFVTCVRDPVRRYVSDYCHFVDRLGSQCDFSQWLKRTDRHNFQTRSIAGEPNLSDAIELLETSFAAVGILERFDELLIHLATIARNTLHVELDLWYEIQNPRRSRRGRESASELIARHEHEIAEVNALDIQLYGFVRDVLVPRQRLKNGLVNAEMHPGQRTRDWHERWRDARRRLLCRLYRNLLYKPHVGRLPAPHRLPIYDTKRQAA